MKKRGPGRRPQKGGRKTEQNVTAKKGKEGRDVSRVGTLTTKKNGTAWERDKGISY